MTFSVSEATVRFGSTTALDRVSITVDPGTIHCVIGGDGAGKSTLLKIMAGLDVGQTATSCLPGPRQLGFVPATGGAVPDLTIDENMELVASVFDVIGWRETSARLLESARLSGFGDRLAKNLSGGQQRKLAASMALLPSPELVVLDEVTTGVDPLSRLELWRLVNAAAAGGTAVVAATTYLDEAERAATITLLHRGRTLASGSPDQVIETVPGVVIETEKPLDLQRAWRHGRIWRQWLRDADVGRQPWLSERTPTLEDAAIVHELIAEEVPA